MILIDSSVWIDHIRTEVPALSALLREEHAFTHPHVIGEVALGNFKNRTAILQNMAMLPIVKIGKRF